MLQKELENSRRQLEENLQQQKQQGEEVKEILKSFGGKLELLEAQFDDIRQITHTLERAVFVGSYGRWPFFDDFELYLIPFPNVKKVLTELENLDVTVNSQRKQGMDSFEQLLSKTEIISVKKNRRFPSNSEHYYLVPCNYWKSGNSFLHMLHSDLERIEICQDIDYAHSKDINFRKCTQMIENMGWLNAYNMYSDLLNTTIELRLERYLWSLCCMLNVKKINNVLRWNGVHNVTSFEKKHNLIWK